MYLGNVFVIGGSHNWWIGWEWKSVSNIVNGGRHDRWVVVFNFDSADFAWRKRRQRADDDKGGDVAAETAKKWQRRQQQRRRRRGICLVAAATQWRQWQQQGWNGDGGTEATGKVATKATAAAARALLGGGSGDATRVERRWKYDGKMQGGGDSNGGGVGFAWRQRKYGDNNCGSKAGMATAKRRRRARWRQQRRRRCGLCLAAAAAR